jgi:hypothetical protein
MVAGHDPGSGIFSLSVQDEGDCVGREEWAKGKGGHRELAEVLHSWGQMRANNVGWPMFEDVCQLPALAWTYRKTYHSEHGRGRPGSQKSEREMCE